MKGEIIQVPLEDYALLFQKATILDFMGVLSEGSPELDSDSLLGKAVCHYNDVVTEAYKQVEEE